MPYRLSNIPLHFERGQFGPDGASPDCLLSESWEGSLSDKFMISEHFGNLEQPKNCPCFPFLFSINPFLHLQTNFLNPSSSKNGFSIKSSPMSSVMKDEIICGVAMRNTFFRVRVKAT